MALNRILYAVFVILLASSPALSLYITGLTGAEFDGRGFWQFLWVGPTLSLPISLLAARSFGQKAYLGYWSYLQSFPNSSKTRILLAWATVAVATLIIGFATTISA